MALIRCGQCKQFKLASEFYDRPGRGCRQCVREKAKRYHAKHRAERIAYFKSAYEMTRLLKAVA